MLFAYSYPTSKSYAKAFFYKLINVEFTARYVSVPYRDRTFLGWVAQGILTQGSAFHFGSDVDCVAIKTEARHGHSNNRCYHGTYKKQRKLFYSNLFRYCYHNVPIYPPLSIVPSPKIAVLGVKACHTADQNVRKPYPCWCQCAAVADGREDDAREIQPCDWGVPEPCLRSHSCVWSRSIWDNRWQPRMHHRQSLPAKNREWIFLIKIRNRSTMARISCKLWDR